MAIDGGAGGGTVGAVSGDVVGAVGGGTASVGGGFHGGGAHGGGAHGNVENNDETTWFIDGWKIVVEPKTQPNRRETTSVSL